jgi:hypothetical protein
VIPFTSETALACFLTIREKTGCGFMLPSKIYDIWMGSNNKVEIAQIRTVFYYVRERSPTFGPYFIT